MAILSIFGINPKPVDPSEPEIPIGNDIVKIVEYYNNAANATKAYTGTMTLDIIKGASSKITETSFPNAAKNIANKMIPNDYPTGERFKVTNGKSGDRSISKMLPIEGNAKMSTLSASGVASATCTKSVNGLCKVIIKLKEENVDSLYKLPANHSSCMACLDISENDLKPFVCKDCNVCYLGGTIEAIINQDGLLAAFDEYNPLRITGTLSWTAITGTAAVDACYRRTVKFHYA